MEDELMMGYGRCDAGNPRFEKTFDPHPLLPKIDRADVMMSKPVGPPNVFVNVWGAPVEKPTAQAQVAERIDYAPSVPTDNWGKYKRFMPIARAFAAMSKDPSTKVGCVVLGTGSFEVRASGWNGAVRGCKADEDTRFQTRETRLAWACHAEANAIANAARTGTPLMGSTMVVTHLPCSSCAKLIVQAAISCVICPKPEPEFAARWAEDIAVTRAMFRECGVCLEDYVEAT